MDAGLFEHFARRGLFEAFARFDKTGKDRIQTFGKAQAAPQQNPILIGNERDHDRIGARKLRPIARAAQRRPPHFL